MIACTRSGLVPKVGGISADSSTPSRPLVPAPTKTMRPPLRSACVMISTPTAMRSFSRCTAAQHLAVLVEHPFDDVGGGELVDGERRRVDGSVGRDCHFERTGMRSDDLRNKPRILA